VRAVRRIHAIIFIVTAFALALVATANGSRSSTDPPRLIPWHQIGNVGFGMTHSRIEYIYGPPANGQTNPSLEYDYHGVGTIGVFYDHSGHVNGLDTKSPEYVAASGLHVGSPIPLGICHRVKHACQYRWRGFILVDRPQYLPDGVHHNQEWDGAFRWGRWTVVVQLFVNRQAVTEIWIARTLQCGNGGTIAGTCTGPA
jgi:hypothetical protein